VGAAHGSDCFEKPLRPLAFTGKSIDSGRQSGGADLVTTADSDNPKAGDKEPQDRNKVNGSNTGEFPIEDD